MVNLIKNEHVQIARSRARDYKFQTYLTSRALYFWCKGICQFFSNVGSIISRADEVMLFRGSVEFWSGLFLGSVDVPFCDLTSRTILTIVTNLTGDTLTLEQEHVLSFGLNRGLATRLNESDVAAAESIWDQL